MTTIKDVAEKAKVAISTASYVLNGIDKVSPKTKARVLKAAQELNYQKNGFAVDLKKTKTNTIALLLDDLAGPFYSVLVKGVQDIVTEHGYGLVACSAIGGDRSTAVKYLKERRADGCIVFANNISDDLIKNVTQRNYPMVLLDRNLDCTSTIKVEVDNRGGASGAVEYLISKGHKDIAYISGPKESYNSQQRFEGYREALKKHHIPFRDIWVINGKFTKEGGELATKLLLAQQEKPTAVFYGNDEMAIGGMYAMKKAGMKLPDEMSVIGFDDILEAKYTNPQLTTIKQPKYELGALAAHLIFKVLENKERTQSSRLFTELLERESVKDL
ncbi:LacI family DNA-binding transcriptional regulator [Bacillus sp. H-16]|uniref:LacI family DNA-binding transcriptional regulator n=1 Tax=Alteribacter salitolerans TaxID=2912333 RepID=UPI0019669D9D|nr:LacI family DNA-binding transcriptional regulator [Alteribacter salitolerans]MBM7097891.1 LacI family DNA-binding transcriptional regulator [Alteribacter salitolerans]